MDDVKPLNNTGGRTLIGNYAEERFLSETKGLDTNTNTIDGNASLAYSNGNSDLITADKSMFKKSLTGENFGPPNSFVEQKGRRASLAEAAARQAATEEFENEAAREAQHNAPGKMMSSTQSQFGAPLGGSDSLNNGNVETVSDIPASVWTDIKGNKFSRTTAFTDGTDPDGLYQQ